MTTETKEKMANALLMLGKQHEVIGIVMLATSVNVSEWLKEIRDTEDRAIEAIQAALSEEA